MKLPTVLNRNFKTATKAGIDPEKEGRQQLALEIGVITLSVLALIGIVYYFFKK